MGAGPGAAEKSVGPSALFDETDRETRLRNTEVFARGLAVVCMVYSALAVMFGLSVSRLGLALAVGGASLGSLVLARHKRPTLAAYVLLGALLASLVAGVVLRHGMGSAVYFLPLPVLLGATTLPPRHFGALLAACLVTLGAMAGLSEQLAPHDRGDVARLTLNGGGLLLLVALVAFVQTRTLRDSLRAPLTQSARAREAERRLRIVADSTSDLISLLDAQGNRLFATPSLLRAFGGEPVGASRPDLVDEADSKAAEAGWRDALTHGRGHATFRVRTQSEGVRWIDAVFTAAEHDGQRYVVFAGRDVTDARALTARLHEARTMEALGRLAGGIAHDFNNMLSVVQACAQNAQRLLPPDHDAQTELTDVMAAVRRASGLTQQLLAFARRDMQQPAEASAGEVVRSVAELLKRVLGASVRMAVDVAPDVPRVAAAPVQLEQLVMNLALNARDAMPHGGELTLSLRGRELREDDGELPAGSYVVLSVRDTGTGMSEDVQRHIFEPFFTTKKAGEGNGLGLSTCYGLARQLGGRIGVESRLGEGSCFSVWLPALPAGRRGSSPAAKGGGQRRSAPPQDRDVETRESREGAVRQAQLEST